MFYKVKKLAQEKKEAINPFSILATAKLIVSSKGFNERLKAFKQANNKKDISQEEMLKVYSEYLSAESND